MENIDFKLEQAAQFEDEKKYLHAVQIYLPLLEIENYSRIAVLKLSDLYEKLNNAEKAEELLKVYIKNNLEDVSIIKHYCHLLLRNNKFEEVIDILSNISIEENPAVYFLSGYAYYHISDFEIAIKHFNKFVYYNKSSELLADAYLFLAKSHLNIGQLDDAEFSAEKSEELFQGNPDLNLIQAIIFYHKEMYLHAYEKIRKALIVNEGEPKYYKWAGKILYKLEEYKKAETHFRNYLANAKPDAELFSLLGNTYLNLENKVQAQEFFDKALEIEPTYNAAIEGKKKCD